jgi:hypothetical protein
MGLRTVKRKLRIVEWLSLQISEKTLWGVQKGGLRLLEKTKDAIAAQRAGQLALSFDFRLGAKTKLRLLGEMSKFQLVGTKLQVLEKKKL